MFNRQLRSTNQVSFVSTGAYLDGPRDDQAPCKHLAERPWLMMPFDAKSDMDTEFGELVWCPDCGVGRTKILPEPEAMSQHYDLPRYYTQGASHMPDIPPSILDRILVKAAWLADKGAHISEQDLAALAPPPGPVLDIGCGGGDRLRKLAELGFEVVGVEPDPVARQRASASGLRVLAGTAENMPEEASSMSYRLVMMSHVLEHCREPVRALASARQHVDASGLVYGEVPNAVSLYFQKFAQISEMLDVPRHLYFFTKRALESMCREVGLEIVQWRYSGYTRHFLPSWCAWENSIRERLVKRGVKPSAPSRSVFSSLALLARSFSAAKDQKYDSIGFVARPRA